MRTVGIICEYNPFHKGHLRQLRLARELTGEDCAIVCLMSGNYVQRGEPAMYPKALRAEAALRCGADLVLELPLTAALSSAEGFAAGGVSILTALGCDALCYGIESDDNNIIMSTAKANLDPAFDALLRAELETGCSYPTARQRVIDRLVGVDAHIDPPSENPQPSVLSNPNDLLAVEYCKAILKQRSPLRPLPIRRTGSYHAETLDPEAPSATALRAALRYARKAFPLGGRRPSAKPPKGMACASEHSFPALPAGPHRGPGAERACTGSDEGVYRQEASFENGPEERNATSSVIRLAGDAGCHLPLKGKALGKPFPDWRAAVPEQLHDLYVSAPIHTMQTGERAVLAVLRSLPDAAFQALPFGSEGLWSKFMKNCRACADLDEIIDATKSKRYTRSRVQRMLLCAFLGLTGKDLETPPPYVRILGFNPRGRALLRERKGRFPLVNAGERPADAGYFALETRAADLYSLFSAAGPRPAGEEARQRVVSCSAEKA